MENDSFFYTIGNLRFRKTNFSEEETREIFRNNEDSLEETLKACKNHETHYHLKIKEGGKEFYVQINSDGAIYIPLSAPTGGKPTRKKTLDSSKINEFNEYIPRRE